VRADTELPLDAAFCPLGVISHQGIVRTAPRPLDTVEQLREMDDIATLLRVQQITDVVSATPRADW
jgi:hypothetical protein